MESACGIPTENQLGGSAEPPDSQLHSITQRLKGSVCG